MFHNNVCCFDIEHPRLVLIASSSTTLFYVYYFRYLSTTTQLISVIVVYFGTGASNKEDKRMKEAGENAWYSPIHVHATTGDIKAVIPIGKSIPKSACHLRWEI